MIAYGHLLRAESQFSGNRNEMISYLRAKYPDIDAADVIRDVDIIINL